MWGLRCRGCWCRHRSRSRLDLSDRRSQSSGRGIRSRCWCRDRRRFDRNSDSRCIFFRFRSVNAVRQSSCGLWWRMFFGSRCWRLSDVWFGNVGGRCFVSDHRRNSSLYWFFNGGRRGGKPVRVPIQLPERRELTQER
jgi:hypothetical protein